jgi:hypothetical protein
MLMVLAPEKTFGSNVFNNGLFESFSENHDAKERRILSG